MIRSPSSGVGGIAPDPAGIFSLPLEEAVLLRRYQRFLADVRRADGSVVTVHVPNTGSMATLNHPGCPAWILPAANPARKLRWTLTMVGTPSGGVAVVDTLWPNRLVVAGVAAGRIPRLAGYAHRRPEAPIGHQGSRCDLLLSGHPTAADAFIEVKNVTMQGSIPGCAEFPDAISDRGRKHLEELTAVAHQGFRGVQFYLINRTDCHAGGLATTIDPAYAEAARRAAAAGVEFIAHRVQADCHGPTWRLSMGPEVPWNLIR